MTGKVLAVSVQCQRVFPSSGIAWVVFRFHTSLGSRTPVALTHLPTLVLEVRSSNVMEEDNSSGKCSFIVGSSSRQKRSKGQKTLAECGIRLELSAKFAKLVDRKGQIYLRALACTFTGYVPLVCCQFTGCSCGTSVR
ncbi:hypothetical protein R1flu_002042 [Riccia fluitans]|uniref:Uncharacterized protein n=1 Tax=Riccia fluitans TaxID=41844 RepID=A0ABD1Y500_9MARC